MEENMKVTDLEIIEACKLEPTMARAASTLKIHFNTFKRRAVKLGVYIPNQSGKGLTKTKTDGKGKISLNEIINGLHPYYQTNKLRIRLLSEGIKEAKCEVCGITEWMGNRLSFELDHIDGDRTNHKIDNIRIICPNCHSQTETYRGKNVGVVE
jgi:hypothetical protein